VEGHNGLLERMKRLRFIQAIGAGADQFPLEDLTKRGIRLGSARSVNYRTVAEHAMALILCFEPSAPRGPR
jgi:lactate dehydrogenase-like 2-hydroxyacid dehydrogenase